MTPKEKADELFQQMFNFISVQDNIKLISISAKYCAIQVVKEILYTLESILINDLSINNKSIDETIDFWKEVEKELRSY